DYGGGALAAALPARRAAAVRQRAAGRNESRRSPAAPRVELPALSREHSVLRVAVGGAPPPHPLGAGPVPLRETPPGRKREDAVRPLLHQAPLAAARREDPVRDGVGARVRSELA